MPDANQSERAEGDPPEEVPELSEVEQAERDRLREEVRRIEAEMAEKQAEEESGYDIPSPPDQRAPMMTGFLVYVNDDGKAIATSSIEEVLANVRFRREATLEDIRRWCAEVTADVDTILRTQNILQSQMQYARQVQEQMQTQAVAQGLDLSKMRSQ